MFSTPVVKLFVFRVGKTGFTVVEDVENMYIYKARILSILWGMDIAFAGLTKVALLELLLGV